MKRVNQFPKIVTALVAGALVVASCSSNSSNDAPLVDNTDVVETTLAPSTTVAWATGAEAVAWEKFLEPYAVIDVSEISTGECGPRAMLVTEESLTMYWWNGVEWKDDSDLLDGGRGDYPIKVYTHDFTNDGVLDFFVLYSETNKPKSPVYGAFFAYTWAQEEQCQWGWVDVDNGRTTTKTLLSPEVNPVTGRVVAPGYTRRRTSVKGEYKFFPPTSSFMYQEPVAK